MRLVRRETQNVEFQEDLSVSERASRGNEVEATHLMRNNIKVCMLWRIIMNAQESRAYVLVEIQPGKEKEFADEVLSRGLGADSKVERMDFVHGSFDFVVMLRGLMKDIDAMVLELRKSPFIRRTETLICFEMFAWEDLSGRLNE